MSSLTFSHTVTERFLRYVTIDTQSDPESPSSPSTEKQKDLGRVLAAELKAMGVEDAHLDDFGYVYGTIPGNTPKKVPVICFCSHMDTSPDVTGKNVKPQMVKNYRGGDITLPGDTSQVIRFAEHPALKNQIGNDIITTDGTTLLGADNKAGVAEIMDAAHFFINNPQVKHGTIKILFTPDEEIGRGVDNVDIKKLGADFGYTMDGESAGSVEDETFSADGATITINGVSAHPGYAKGKMEHAIKIAAAIVERLAPGRLLARDDIRQAGFSASDRDRGCAGAGYALLHCARLHRGRAEGEGDPAREHRQGRDEGFSALDLHIRGAGAVPQHEAGDRSPPAHS
ncbi:peptidase T [Bradyrhizobium sp. GM6.1]